MESNVPTYNDFTIYLETEGENARKVFPDKDKCVHLFDEEIFKLVINNKFSGRILTDIRLSGNSIGENFVISPNKCQKLERPINSRLPARKFQFVKFGGHLASEVSATSNKSNCDEIQVIIKPEKVNRPVFAAAAAASTPINEGFDNECETEGIDGSYSSSNRGHTASTKIKKGSGIECVTDCVDGSYSSSNRGCAILSSIDSTQKFKSVSSFETDGIFYFIIFLKELIKKRPMRIEDAYGVEDC